jgi:hypothetical protein
VNQNAPTGICCICCIKQLSGVIPPNPHIKAIRVGGNSSEAETAKRNTKEVKAKNIGKRGQQKGTGGNERNKQRGAGEGKLRFGESQCSRITF